MNRSLTALSLALLVAGCGGGGGGGADMAITADQACTEAANALCAKAAACSPIGISLVYGDMATCLDRAKLGCLRSSDLKNSARTNAQIVACTAAVAGVSCDDIATGKLPADCVPKAGMLANGNACGDDSQCMSTYCSRPKGSTCGACGPRPVAGDSCATISCGGQGLVCSGMSKKCVTYATLNQNCSADQPCLPSLSCKTPMGQAMGSCVMPLGTGETCGTDTAGCDNVKGLFCNGMQCATVAYANGGEPCGLIAGKITACNKSGTCRLAMMGMGTCIAAAADGAACDDANGPKCLPPAECVNGACKLADPSTCM